MSEVEDDHDDDEDLGEGDGADAPPVSLEEAKVFLRVGHEAEDGLIQTLLEAARARVEGEVGQRLTLEAPAPLRLAIMLLVLKAFERGDEDMSLAPVEAWIAPYRSLRL